MSTFNQGIKINLLQELSQLSDIKSWSQRWGTKNYIDSKLTDYDPIQHHKEIQLSYNDLLKSIINGDIKYNSSKNSESDYISIFSKIKYAGPDGSAYRLEFVFSLPFEQVKHFGAAHWYEHGNKLHVIWLRIPKPPIKTYMNRKKLLNFVRSNHSSLIHELAHISRIQHEANRKIYKNVTPDTEENIIKYNNNKEEIYANAISITDKLLSTRNKKEYNEFLNIVALYTKELNGLNKTFFLNTINKILVAHNRQKIRAI